MLTIVHFITFALVFVVVNSFYKDAHHCNFEHEGGKRNITSCSKQLPYRSLAENDCIIWNIQDREECETSNFQISEEHDLGQVKLVPFVDVHDETKFPLVSAINVTFLDVKWNRLRFQWKERRNGGKYFCREFHLSSNIELSFNESIYYDCPWLLSIYEQHEFDFKYEARDSRTGHTEGRYYIFKLPSNRDIDPAITHLENWKVFSYIDISALPILTVRWQQPPRKFNVKQYEVQFINNETLDVLDTKIVEADPENDQLAVDFNGGLFSDSIYITIKIDNYTGSISKTPVISLVYKSSYIALYLSVGVLLFGIIFLLLIFSYMRREYMGRRPSILIIYKYARISHMKALIAFTECLKKVTHAEVLLDELHIPLSETKNPFLWYQEAFDRAEYILVMANPSVSTRCEEGIYPNVDTVGLRLFEEKFADKNCHKRFFTVIFPYCKDSDVPPAAINLKCFKLMKDFIDMVTYIHTNSHQWLPVQRLLSLCGKSVNMKDHCKPLQQSFKEAEKDLQNCSLGRADDNKKPAVEIDVLKQLDTVAPLPDFEDVYCQSPSSDVHDEDVGFIFPGDINELNLLGSEREEEVEKNVRTNSISSDLDIHDLLLNV